MRNDYADSRFRPPRLIGTASVFLGLLVLIALGTGGAVAAVGATDLSLTKSDSPDPVVAGNNLTYTITVSNPGPNDASNVVVTDNLPGGVDFVSATGGTCDRTGNTVTCNLGQVNAGQSPTVTIVVRTKKEGTLTNTASVTSPQDAVLGNNSATATTTVQKSPGKGKGQASCAAPTITGTPGNDVITGTTRTDVINTFAGDDQVFALDGKDLVCTKAGFDLVKGGAKSDTVIGGADADRLIGNKGGDLLKGKAGPDKLRGKGGSDTLNGGSGRDSCKGGAGRDVLKRCP